MTPQECVELAVGIAGWCVFVFAGLMIMTTLMYGLGPSEPCPKRQPPTTQLSPGYIHWYRTVYPKEKGGHPTDEMYDREVDGVN